MKHVALRSFLPLAVFLACASYLYGDDAYKWVYIDFDSSMQTALYPQAIATTLQVVDLNGTILMDFLKKLYEKNNLSVIKPQQTLKIPKIIHQVWLGGPFPDVFKKYTQTWVDRHLGRGWKYKLWTDADVKTFKLVNQEFYDATDGVGAKSDLFRWEILYRYGGVYIDVDLECLQPINILHYTYDFYTGIQPLDTQYLQLGAAIVGSVPGHPILKHCIDSIKDDWHRQGAPAKTGPIHLTRSFFAAAGKSGFCDIAFPASYFYPLGCVEAPEPTKKEGWIKNGAWAVHMWAKSWMPIQYRKGEFRTLRNDNLVTTWRE